MIVIMLFVTAAYELGFIEYEPAIKLRTDSWKSDWIAD